MYQPPHFKEEDTATLHALIRAHPLGLLITSGSDGLTANPLPFQLDATASEKGMLRVHLARANQQWKQLRDGAEMLVVFQGANTYITPSWYATKRETGKVVPTWNYAQVQVRGKAQIKDDAHWLATQINDLTAGHEQERDAPWAVSDAPDDYIRSQIKGIVGVEIDILHIEGKWKVSQNRPQADRDGVTAGLIENSRSPDAAIMADLVKQFGNDR
jgi:transcriptional regulator